MPQAGSTHAHSDRVHAMPTMGWGRFAAMIVTSTLTPDMQPQIEEEVK